MDSSRPYIYMHQSLGLGVAPDFGLGVAGGSWAGLGKHYSLLCTESILESVFFQEKEKN